MATYLKFHQLERSPFEGRGSHQLVLATSSLRRAYAEIKSGLNEGSPRICLSGGSGIGKSSLARALPKLLESNARCVLIRDSESGWSRIKASIARQLDLEGGQVSRTTLIAARRDGRRIVLVIDQAEELSAESLEHLDLLLGYRDDEGAQLVHCVLLANLEEAPRGREIPLLWWLDRLTTRQLSFSPIPEDGIRSYVDKHLKKAGFRGTSIFSHEAVTAIYRYTGGVPGAVSALCEELLSQAADQRKRGIDADLVAIVCGDELPLNEEAERDPAEGAVRTLGEDPVKPVPAPKPAAEEGLSPFDERRAIPIGAPDPFAEPETELKVQQGLVHMDEPEAPAASSVFADLADDDSFSAFQPSRLEAWPQRELPRYVSQPSPGSGRGARIVRNLMGFALLTCILMALHMVFFAGEPALPRLTKPIPPPAFLKGGPPEPGIEAPTTAAESGGRPEPRELEIATEEPRPETILEPEEPAGLTLDLRLDPSTTNAAALAESAGPVAEQPEAVDEASDLSLDELYELAEQTDEGPEVFEPWAEQAPDSAAAPEPTTSSNPAMPAPRP